MRLTSLLLGVAIIAASGTAMADTMKASPKPPASMKSSSMKSDHMMASPKPHASMKSDHMMGSPKPKSTMKP